MIIRMCANTLDIMRTLPYGSFFLTTVPADGNTIVKKTRRLTVEMISGAVIQAYLKQLPTDSNYSVVQRAMATETIARMTRLIKQETIKAVGSRISPTVDEMGLIPLVKTSLSYIAPCKLHPFVTTLTLNQGERMLMSNIAFISHSLLNLRWEETQQEASINDAAVVEFIGSLINSSEERACFLHNIMTRLFNPKGPPFGMFLNGPSRRDLAMEHSVKSPVRGLKSGDDISKRDHVDDDDNNKHQEAAITTIHSMMDYTEIKDVQYESINPIVGFEDDMLKYLTNMNKERVSEEITSTINKMREVISTMENFESSIHIDNPPHPQINVNNPIIILDSIDVVEKETDTQIKGWSHTPKASQVKATLSRTLTIVFWQRDQDK
eukprot:GHVR01004565.1.p1 GENE.GHVR01004565.1~~GHVR01004565.1.p1  ORF type:complete len:380 (-),score=48.77 GHVR01004565.1:210-1349(-)